MRDKQTPVGEQFVNRQAIIAIAEILGAIGVLGTLNVQYTSNQGNSYET